MIMARIPVRFERVAAAFASDAAARVRLCESSGSEHSPESSTDLSDLVKSFMERDGSEEGLDCHDQELLADQIMEKEHKNELGSDNENDWPYSEKKDSLRNLLGHSDDDDMVKRKIFCEAKSAYENIGDIGSFGFKRRLMTSLRDKGFDAGLCKSKWERSKRFPAGDYEYVDVNVQGTRYIVEAFLVGEFEIARPTDQYTSLLEIFPQIFVGKVGELKQIVRLMCNAIRESMKSKDMPMPPWRRNGYMQAKWFGSYKRTTRSIINSSKNKALSKSDDRAAFDAKRSVGFEFEALPTVSYSCRGDFRTRVGLRVSHLTAAFNS